MKIDKTPVLLFIVVSLSALFTACNSYKVKSDTPAVERYELAKKMFANKDYFQAKTQFKILTLNNPGASFVDEVQYYLAESHFYQKEYILAADEYNRLTRLYPKSDWVDDAQFKAAVCDFRLSPKPALDQTHTIKAVANLQMFIEDHPTSERIPEAEKLLKICRTKLAEKEFRAGELYRKLGDYNGAYIYFKSVIDSYYDTVFNEPASYWQAECLFRLRRGKESRHAFEELLRKYPKSRFAADARQRLEKLEADSLQAKESDDKKNRLSN